VRQSAQQVDAWPDWKLEVNRLVAEHKGRKGHDVAMADIPTGSHRVDSPAAKAAAKVAARFTKKPSYSELMAEEARAALRAAEAAFRAAHGAALEAHAAAESALAGLEAAAAASEQQAWEPVLVAETDLERKWALANGPVCATGTDGSGADDPQPSSASGQGQSFEIRWDSDLPVREAGPREAGPRGSRGKGIVEVSGEDIRREDRQVSEAADDPGFEVVEAAQAIPANLIRFPRELVATRKIRPRRAEGPYAASFAAQGQLSIFEVEQSDISTEPEAASPAAETGKHAWAGPGWQGIELDAEPEHQIAARAEAPTRVERAEPAPVVAALRVAPLNVRLMAAVVDFSLIMAGFLTAVAVAAENASVMPSVKELEWGSVLALAVTCVLYQALFLTLSRATPGMKYAGLELCTLDGKWPSTGQRWIRAAASILSILPAGLGAVSAIFAEHSLCWHDRISGTYLRKG
jgi:uncharacterized RDD family membrane protein YckC